MLGVIFFLENNIHTPGSVDHTVDRLAYNCRNMGVSDILIVDETQYCLLPPYLAGFGDAEINLHCLNNVSEADNYFPSIPIVALENKHTLDDIGITEYSSLRDFTHPTPDAIYLVGRNFGGIPVNTLSVSSWVYVEAADLWSEEVLTITMYDRLIKAL